MNELRGFGFDQTSGEAAIGKLGIKLADIGQVVFNGSFKNYGFGGVQSKISERSRDNLYEIGLTANLNLDKFYLFSGDFKFHFIFHMTNEILLPNLTL